MATCALMGQAIGTAAAEMVRSGTTPDTVDIKALQDTLMDDDCYLPGFKREPKTPTRVAKITNEVLRDGIDRGDEHSAVFKIGESAEYTFDTPTRVSGALHLRLQPQPRGLAYAQKLSIKRAELQAVKNNDARFRRRAHPRRRNQEAY